MEHHNLHKFGECQKHVIQIEAFFPQLWKQHYLQFAHCGRYGIHHNMATVNKQKLYICANPNSMFSITYPF